MWVFLLIFFLVAGLFTLLNLSLAESRKVLWVSIGIITIFCLATFPIGIKQTKDTLNNILQTGNIVSLLALIQIFEAIFRIFLSIAQIKGHYQGAYAKFLKWISALPSLVFLGGLFFVQTYAFVAIEGYPFWLVSLAFSLLTGATLLLLTLLIKKIYASWDVRAEKKMLTALFQVLLAMFLPLIVKGVKVPFSQLEIELLPLILTIGVVSFFAGIGALLKSKDLHPLSYMRKKLLEK